MISMKKTLVISAYTCCGKTYASEHMEDYDILNKSNALFARKFSSDRMEIVDKLERNLLERKATK